MTTLLDLGVGSIDVVDEVEPGGLVVRTDISRLYYEGDLWHPRDDPVHVYVEPWLGAMLNDRAMDLLHFWSQDASLAGAHPLSEEEWLQAAQVREEGGA